MTPIITSKPTNEEARRANEARRAIMRAYFQAYITGLAEDDLETAIRDGFAVWAAISCDAIGPHETAACMGSQIGRLNPLRPKRSNTATDWSAMVAKAAGEAA